MGEEGHEGEGCQEGRCQGRCFSQQGHGNDGTSYGWHGCHGRYGRHGWNGHGRHGHEPYGRSAADGRRIDVRTYGYGRNGHGNGRLPLNSKLISSVPPRLPGYRSEYCVVCKRQELVSAHSGPVRLSVASCYNRSSSNLCFIIVFFYSKQGLLKLKFKKKK